MKSGDAQHSTLADELRTAAIELTRGAGRRGIEQLAAQVERGKSLESALQDTGCRLPTYYRQAILASVKTGDLPLCLTELARYDRQQGEKAKRFTKPQSRQQMVNDPNRMMQFFTDFDGNKDGKLELHEVPEQVRERFGRFFPCRGRRR